MEAAVSTHELSKRFGPTLALDRLDLTIHPGEAVGLLGHNGAGKTTAVRILATLLQPDTGSATVLGHDVERDPGAVREVISLAGQQATLDEHLTGRENLILLGRLQRLSRGAARTRADELLERFDLSAAANRVVSTYSGGMRRRLDLAACMVQPRPVVFLDEPTTGLDPIGRSGVLDLIEDMVSEGTALLLTTQYLEEADRLCDRITVLADGRTVAAGTPTELKDRVGDRQVDLVVPDGESTAAVSALAAAGLGAELDDRDRRITVRAPHGDTDLERVLSVLRSARVPVDEIALRRPTLDDAFFALAGGRDELEEVA
jgi:ABC-2 type transport system ATP-binding protein